MYIHVRVCIRVCVPSLLGRIKFWPIKKFKGKTAAATFMRVRKTIRERQEGGRICVCVSRVHVCDCIYVYSNVCECANVTPERK